mmetsp:Transcript_6268/g.13790  ORF Transcript_6268/g.13790 Transcript_6268/m.13790 type:complete len:341 (+) Transcript_6268:1048-2070(+)
MPRARQRTLVVPEEEEEDGLRREWNVCCKARRAVEMGLTSCFRCFWRIVFFGLGAGGFTASAVFSPCCDSESFSNSAEESFASYLVVSVCVPPASSQSTSSVVASVPPLLLRPPHLPSHPWHSIPTLSNTERGTHTATGHSDNTYCPNSRVRRRNPIYPPIWTPRRAADFPKSNPPTIPPPFPPARRHRYSHGLFWKMPRPHPSKAKGGALDPPPPNSFRPPTMHRHRKKKKNNYHQPPDPTPWPTTRKTPSHFVWQMLYYPHVFSPIRQRRSSWSWSRRQSHRSARAIATKRYSWATNSPPRVWRRGMPVDSTPGGGGWRAARGPRGRRRSDYDSGAFF